MCVCIRPIKRCAPSSFFDEGKEACTQKKKGYFIIASSEVYLVDECLKNG
jgi:hypothetical protein